VNILEFIAQNMGAIVDHVRAKHPDRAWMYEVRKSYWQRAARAREEGRPVVWHSFDTVPELFFAFDLAPICTDVLSAVVSALPGGIARYADLAQGYVPDHVCTIDRTLMGLAMGGFLPQPDLIIHTSQPCDSTLITYPVLAQYLGVPHLTLDTPYWGDRRSLDYAARELQKEAAFIEKHTGRALDRERLAWVIDLSNQAYRLIGEVNELRKAVPCPLPSKLLPLTGGMFGCAVGTPELLAYVRRMRDWARERVARGQGQLQEERLRLGWVQIPIYFNTSICDWLEQEYGAVAPMDLLNNYQTIVIDDPGDPQQVYQGLAQRMLRMTMGQVSRGPSQYYIQSALEVCRDYKADVAVASGHLGCKQMWGAFQLVKDVLADELGIPTFIYDCDHLDPRVVSLDQIKARFEEFFSTLRLGRG